MKQYFSTIILTTTLLSAFSQARIIKTTTPCNDEILYKTSGEWIKSADVWQVDHIKFTSSQQQEVINRVDKISEMMKKIYPEPMGVDAVWQRTLGYSTFGDKVTYIRTDPFSLDRKTIVEKPVATFGYVSGFFRHYCSTANANEIRSGHPGETGTWLNIFTNTFGGFATEYFGNQDTFTIGGYPVHLRHPLKQSFDGYEIYNSKEVVDNPDVTPQRFALIHRKGVLPYIPITRKQYLEKCLSHIELFQDMMIKSFEETPLTTGDGQGSKNEQLAEMKKNKAAILKWYKNELEETTRLGLLNAPAIIPVTMYNMDENTPIFVEENKGWMIVRVNPEYMRTDLPKHVPQLFVVNWYWNDWKPQANVGKLIEENFPFAQLQAMIDK